MGFSSFLRNLIEVFFFTEILGACWRTVKMRVLSGVEALFCFLANVHDKGKG